MYTFAVVGHSAKENNFSYFHCNSTKFQPRVDDLIVKRLKQESLSVRHYASNKNKKATLQKIAFFN